ncbi:pickpocket protein 28 [Scaptodrosophila lebanonensis]|uniref:Pickpocket protein 28 n=1 Tax=Drosophila lebanonensis TaxID=7225 RepID=A0A6J2TXJ5_DROLE|nr:pickpocket protein 28 [Scaptodrosophila lebanonensis]
MAKELYLEMRAHRVRHNFWRRQLRILAPPPVPTWRRFLAQNTDDFCRNSTIHGLKYLNNRQLRVSDRVFFGLALIAVVCIALFLIVDAFEKWNTTPVIVGINPDPTYITNEPFPAVTICNLNQALYTKAMQFANDTAEYAMLQLLCHRSADQQLTDAITNWERLEQFIFNISQPCEAMVIGCRFGAEDYNCARMFLPIVTDEGLCCVFNMLHPRFMYKHNIPLTLRNVSNALGDFRAVNWYAEQGYAGHTQGRFYPRTAQGTGESLGLSLTLDVQADDYYCSSSNSIGFKISLHSPNESPNVRETGVLLAPGLETKLRIEPAKIVTEQQLRSLDRKYRRCLFHSEGKLRYFAHYTQRNCEMECLSRLLLQHCGCISFYMPRVRGNDPICSIRKSPCVESVRLHTVAAVESCLDDCLPSCFDLTYNMMTSYAKISTVEHNLSEAYVERSVAVVNMYYKEHTFRAHKQTEFIGISDFLSSVGGLMGLFLGFSFLSIAECIYFAFIRPCRSCAESRRLKAVSIKQRPRHNAIIEVVASLTRQSQQQQQDEHLFRILPAKWLEAELNQQRYPPRV